MKKWIDIPGSTASSYRSVRKIHGVLVVEMSKTAFRSYPYLDVGVSWVGENVGLGAAGWLVHSVAMKDAAGPFDTRAAAFAEAEAWLQKLSVLSDDERRARVLHELNAFHRRRGRKV